MAFSYGYFDAESFLQKHLPQYAQNYRLIRKMEEIGQRPCSRILSALQEFFETDSLKEIQLDPLEGGMTNSVNIKVASKGKTYVVHFFDLTFSFDPLRNEISSLEAASAAGIAPEVYYKKIFPDGGVEIMEFLPGKSVQLEELRDKSLFPRLIETIKAVHELPADSFPSSPDVMKTLAHDMYYLEMNNWLNPKTHLVQESLEKLERQMKKISFPVVPSHWDLNPRNIFIRNGKAIFIDWGLARLENPFYDLGYFSLVSSLNEEEEEAMLNLYIGEKATGRDRAFLYLYKNLACARIGTNFYKKFIFHGGRDLKETPALTSFDLIKLHAFEQHEGTKELTEEIILAAYNNFLKNAYSEKMRDAIHLLTQEVKGV